MEESSKMDENEEDVDTDVSEADDKSYEPEDSELSQDLDEDVGPTVAAKKKRGPLDRQATDDAGDCSDLEESEDATDVDEDEVADMSEGKGDHSGKKPFECDICQKKFTKGNTLKLHKRAHAGEKAFKCSVCQKAFNHSTNLTTHMRLHTGEKPYQCDVCQKTFTHSNTLKMHKRIHTGECPYKCTVCSDSFPRRDQLTRHMSLHTGMKPYPCKMCSKSFSQIDSLKTHMEIHTDVKPYECGVCQKKFASHVTLKRHMKNHNEKTFQCTMCERKFVFKTELTRHMVTAHSDERPFECSLCEKTFQVANNLKKHMIVHTKEKPYKCPFCEKPYSTKNRMNVHKRLQHTKEGLHECEICSRMFPFPANLRKHMMSHTSYEKKYPCDVCDKAFTSNYNLVIHLTTHTGVKLFPCPMCKKEFSYSKSMKDHAMVHFDSTLLASGQSFTHGQDKDEKICLKCPFCLKEFSYFKHYRAHMDLHPESSFLQIPNSEDSSQTPGASGDLPGDFMKESTVPGFDADATTETSDGVLEATFVSRGDSVVFRCPVCEIENESKLFMRAHMFIHYDIGMRGKKKKPKRKLRPFKCVLCPKTFVAVKYLRRHTKRCHSQGPNFSGSGSFISENQDEVISLKVEPESGSAHEDNDISSEDESGSTTVEPSTSTGLHESNSDKWTYRFEPPESQGECENKPENEPETSKYVESDIDVKPLVQTLEPNSLETTRQPHELYPSQATPQINDFYDTQTTGLASHLAPRTNEFYSLQPTLPTNSHDNFQPFGTEERVLERDNSVAKPKKKQAKIRTFMPCTVCGRSFVYAKSFQNHMQEHEENRIKSTFQVKPPEPIKVNVASLCKVSEKTPHKPNVQDSGRSNTGPVKPKATEANPLTTDVKPILCNKCGGVFPDASALQVHQLLVHLPKLSLDLFP